MGFDLQNLWISFFSPYLGTPPTTDKANIEAVRGFGRFPRGALIWSSDGKRENVSCMSTSNLLGPSRLDFSQVSPLSVLSPQTNPSTPFSNNLQTPKSGGGPVPLENSQPQQTTSSAPLINATNSEHKIKPRVSSLQTRKYLNLIKVVVPWPKIVMKQYLIVLTHFKMFVKN